MKNQIRAKQQPLQKYLSLGKKEEFHTFQVKEQHLEEDESKEMDESPQNGKHDNDPSYDKEDQSASSNIKFTPDKDDEERSP